MLYLFHGTEQFFLQNWIDKQLAKNMHLVLQSDYAKNIEIDDLYKELATEDIFGEQKLIIIQDFQLLNEEQFNKAKHLNLFKTASEVQNILVCVYNKDEAIPKKFQKLSLELFEKAEVIDIKKKNDNFYLQWVKKELQKLQLNFAGNDDDLRIFITNYHQDLMLIQSELFKLQMEKGKNSIIKKTDILNEELLLEETIFTFINALEKNDFMLIEKYYQNIKKYQQQYFSVFGLLLKNYKEIYQIQKLKKINYPEHKIAQRLKLHPFRYKILEKSARVFNEKSCKIIIQTLLQAEKGIKTGLYSPQQALDTVMSTILVKNN